MGVLDTPGYSRAQADARALRTQLRAGNLLHGLRPIATRNRAVHARDSATNSQSDGTRTVQTSILKHYVVETAYDLRLVFGNSAWWNTLATQYPITVTAAIKLSGTIFQVTFGGQASKGIDPMGYAVSDPIAVKVTAGTTLEVRTCVTVASGAKWPAAMLVSSGEGRVDDSDATMVGSPSANGTTAYPVYGVTAIIGQVPAPVNPSVLIYGDSIMQGVGGVSTTQQPLDAGWIAKVLNNQYGYVQASLYGDSAVNLVPAARDRAKFLGTMDYTLCGLGSNDIYVNSTSLATLQNALVGVWSSANARGSRVLQSTITPRSSSTDGWTTTSGQTVSNSTLNATRVAFNGWVRDGAPMSASFSPLAAGTTDPAAIRAGALPHPLYGYIEVADAVETARDSGLWKTTNGAPTSDGIHPTSTVGEALLIAGVSLVGKLPLY